MRRGLGFEGSSPASSWRSSRPACHSRRGGRALARSSACRRAHSGTTIAGRAHLVDGIVGVGRHLGGRRREGCAKQVDKSGRQPRRLDLGRHVLDQAHRRLRAERIAEHGKAAGRELEPRIMPKPIEFATGLWAGPLGMKRGAACSRLLAVSSAQRSLSLGAAKPVIKLGTDFLIASDCAKVQRCASAAVVPRAAICSTYLKAAAR